MVYIIAFIGFASVIYLFIYALRHPPEQQINQEDLIEGNHSIQKLRKEFAELKKEVNAWHKELIDKREAEFRRKYFEDLNSDEPNTRFWAINALSEIGDLTCILPLLNVLKNDGETDENRKMAEDAIVAIIDRTEEPIPKLILKEMEIPQEYINSLTSPRQMIEEIQKREVLKKLRTRKT